MADEKDIIVEFLKGKSASKSKFYFKDFTDLFPDKGPREVKKILTRLVNEEVLEFWSSGSTTMYGLKGAGKQAHLVHGVQKLAVGGLKAVDLRDGPGDDDRHGIGHIVDLQRLGDGLLQHLGPQAHDVGVGYLGFGLVGVFLLWHRDIRPIFCPSLGGHFQSNTERDHAFARYRGIRLAKQMLKDPKI